MQTENLFLTKSILESAIIKHKNAYYNELPIISNEEYDSIVNSYHKILSNLSIPLSEGVDQRIGSPVNSIRDIKIKHKIPMGGLEKINSEEGFNKFMKKLAYGEAMIMMPKYNGISIDMELNNGKLVRALTRGDNEYGVDISEKVILMDFQFDTIKEKNFIGHIRGEIIISNFNWTSFPNKDHYSNQLNATIGICNADYSEKYLNLYPLMQIQPFNVIGNGFSTFGDIKLFLKEFKNFNYMFVERNITYKQAQQYFESISDVPIDGIVISPYLDPIMFDEKKEYPKNQIAVKFIGDTQEFEIDHIEWKVSRRGKLSPVAVFTEGKELSGVIVRKATAFNYEFVKINNLGKGATVLVVRSGEIIPYILEVLKPSEEDEDSKQISIHGGYCPSCGTELEIDGVDIYCKSEDCFDKQAERLNYFLKTIRFKNFSESTVNMIVSDGYKYPWNLTYYTKEQLLKKDGWQSKKIEKFLKEVNEKLINIPILQFFSALGVDGISEEIWKTILLHMDKLAGLENFIKGLIDGNVFSSELINIKNIGESRISSLRETFRLPFDIETWEQTVLKICYLDERIDFNLEKEDNISKLLEGYAIEVTGKLYKIKREEIYDLAKQNGARISGKFNLLICNESSSSSKYQMALKNNIKIITEDEFLKMVGNHD